MSDPSTTAERTRERLLEAATNAFAAKGFHGTTTRDIATAAGLSPAGVYVHHRSKEALLYAICEQGHRRTLELVRQTTDGPGDPALRLRALMHAFTLWHAVWHTRARVVNYELAALSPRHLTAVAATRRAIEEEVRAVVRAGVATAAFATDDPELTARALLSLGIDVARWYRDDGTWSAAAIADHYAGLALRMVGA